MKRTLWRVTTAAAAAMSVGLVLPLTAIPAQADVGAVVGIVQAVYSLYQKFAGGGMSLDQAVQQINADIQTAKNDIVHEIDLVAAANIQGCANSAVVEHQPRGGPGRAAHPERVTA